MLKSRGFWIGIVISLIFIGLFVRSTDFGEVADAFGEANYAVALLSLPVYFLALWMRTLRWQYLLRPVKRIAAIRLYPVVIIGLMANNLIPARMGELARAYVLGTREKISKTTSLGTIAVDRLFDGLTLVPMMLIVAAFAGGDASFPVGFGYELNFSGLGIVMSIFFGLALAVLIFLAFNEGTQHLLHAVLMRAAPGRFHRTVEDLLESFYEGLHALRSPLDMALAWIMSVISWTLEATMYYIVARAFGIDEPFYVFLLLCAAANLAIAIVASQGGIGPFELVVSNTIIAFGASSDIAAAYAIGLHALLLIPITVLGLVLMWSMKLTFSDMLKTSDRTRPDDLAEPGQEPVTRLSATARPATEGQGRK